MNLPDSWKDACDPYTGLMVNPPGPKIEGLPLPGFFEELTEERIYDEHSGACIGKKPAKVYRCYFCGNPTTIQVPLDGELYLKPPNELAARFTWRAQCPDCGRKLMAESGRGAGGLPDGKDSVAVRPGSP